MTGAPPPAAGTGTSGALPPRPGCTDTTCVTCADEAVPMRVVEGGGEGLAWCADGDARREVMTALVGRVRPGDVLLVHAGTALGILPPPSAESP